MPWSTSDRRTELPPNWPLLRRRVLVRDRHRCTWRNDDGQACGAPATDVDHVRRGGDHSMENLRSLCTTHHRIKSSGEGWAERNRLIQANSRRFRRTEGHPGILSP